MLHAMGDTFLAGTITLVTEPRFQPPFDRFWCPPRQLRQLIAEKGWQRVVAHQTRNVPHKGHEWLMKGAWFAANGDLPVEELHTGVLVNCIIGPKKVGDYIDEAILLGHQELQDAGYFRPQVHLVSFALWDMRYAGPREALLHAIIRTNLGCTHHMFGRDHAGVSGFYDPYDAHRIFDRIRDGALQIKPIRVLEWWYCPVCGEMTYSGLCAHTDKKESISGTRLRQMIRDRAEPPATLMRPEVFTKTLACADQYGFGSPFCTDRYLARRGPVFTLEEG
jgi:sulfate adenylyltransferase